MEQYQIRENEKFFKKIISSLNEGGIYLLPSALEVYTKKGDFLVGTKDGLKKNKKNSKQRFFQRKF